MQDNQTTPRELSSTEMLELLFQYNIRIAQEKQLDNLLILMADLGRELAVSDRCALWLIDAMTNEVWTRVAHGVAELRMPMDQGFVGYCISSRESVIVNDPYSDSRFNQEMDKKTGYKTNSVIAIPIIDSEDNIIGVYQSVNKLTTGHKFTQSDLEHLSLTATYSEKAIESALLLKEIESTQRDLIHILSEAGESRSKETGNHVRRVGEFCYLIAKKVGLSEEEAGTLRVASPLHDIGKIAIPDAILNKPGKLTKEEFEVMKTHASIGFEMLNNSPRMMLKAAAIVAGQHHEKYNGKGYPNGLKGDNIHIYGRICAVADVFDALSCDRCYKKAWPLDKVLKLFKEESGEHFDPKLVQVLFDSLDEFNAISEKYKDAYQGGH